MPAGFWLHSDQYTASQFRSLPMHPSEIFALVRRVFHYVICFTWLMGLSCLCRFLFGVFVFLLCLVWRSLTGILPISLCSFRIHSFPNITLWDSLACLALGPHRPSVSPVLCGLSPVSQVSPAAQGFVVFVVVGFCVGFVVCGFLVRFLLSVFVLFLVPFASLHALALSLTGA